MSLRATKEESGRPFSTRTVGVARRLIEKRALSRKILGAAAMLLCCAQSGARQWYLLSGYTTEVSFIDRISGQGNDPITTFWTEVRSLVPRVDHLSRLREKWAVNCADRKLGELTRITYTDSGGVTEKTPKAGAAQLDMAPITPDSLREAMIEAVCPPPDGHPSGPSLMPVQVELNTAVERDAKLVKLGVNAIRASFLASMDPQDNPAFLELLGRTDYIPPRVQTAARRIFGLEADTTLRMRQPTAQGAAGRSTRSRSTRSARVNVGARPGINMAKINLAASALYMRDSSDIVLEGMKLGFNEDEITILLRVCTENLERRLGYRLREGP